MRIYCSKAGKPKSVQPVIPAGQLVNKIGNYFYRHLDGAFKFEKKANEYDVWVTVLYQIPPEVLKRYNITDEKYKSVQEMTVDINITTYSNKIRVNTIVEDPDAKTLGFDLFPPEKLQDLNKAFDLIYPKVCRRIEKEFRDYVFMF